MLLLLVSIIKMIIPNSSKTKVKKLLSDGDIQGDYPGQEVRPGSTRKTLEIGGNMEAVFQLENLRIFPLISG